MRWRRRRGRTCWHRSSQHDLDVALIIPHGVVLSYQLVETEVLVTLHEVWMIPIPHLVVQSQSLIDSHQNRMISKNSFTVRCGSVMKRRDQSTNGIDHVILSVESKSQCIDLTLQLRDEISLTT